MYICCCNILYSIRLFNISFASFLSLPEAFSLPFVASSVAKEIDRKFNLLFLFSFSIAINVLSTLLLPEPKGPVKAILQISLFASACCKSRTALYEASSFVNNLGRSAFCFQSLVSILFLGYPILEIFKKHLLVLVNKFLYLNIFSLAKKAANQFIVLFFYFITRKIRTA